MSNDDFVAMDIQLGEYKVPAEGSLTQDLNQDLSSLKMLTPIKLYTPIELSELAGKSGFRKETQFITGSGGNWQVFERFGYKIPNFPEGETTLDSMLGIYEKEKHGEKVTLPVLRISKAGAIPPGQFRKDMETITRNYIERPVLFGFPSKAIASPITYALVFFGVGSGAALSGMSTTGVLYVDGGALAVQGVLHFLSEVYALKSVLVLEDYFAGSDAVRMLSNERSYALNVQAARELYGRLKDQKFELGPSSYKHPINPKNFLGVVWNQLRPELLRKLIAGASPQEVINETLNREL